MSEIKKTAEQTINGLAIKTSHYLIGGMSLVVALSWNDTVKETIKTYYPLENEELRARIIYSLVVTMLLVIVVMILPDTKKELPKSTQKKLDIEKIKIENKNLKNQLKKQQKQLQNIKKQQQDIQKQQSSKFWNVF